MKLGLKGKVALVTGGTRGIGLMTAWKLKKEGCTVETCSRSYNESLAQWGIHWHRCNVTYLDQLERMVDDVLAERGHVDILVNNVGGGGRWGTDEWEDADDEVWTEVMEKNWFVAHRLTMALLPQMMERGWGRVVTVASIHGREGGGRPWFTSTKAAQIALMKSLAQCKRYARAGVTFNSVAPGPVMIEGTGWDEMKRTDAQGYRDFREALPMGRLGRPEEVVAVVAFLCSEGASWVNGACIAVDGGQGMAF